MKYEFLRSKRFWVTAIGLASTVAAGFGLDIDQDVLIAIVGFLIGAYNIGQGLADQGKEAEKIKLQK